MKFISDNIPDKPIVLYHAISSYQLIEVILHRMIYHEKDKAILILPDFIIQKYPNYKNLISKKLFDEVYLFPYLYIPHHNEKQIKEDVSRYYNQIIPYDIKQFSKIYVSGAHFYFSLYLIENQIPFIFFEDAAGMLSRAQELYKNLTVNFPLHAHIANKYGLFDGNNKYITKIICLKDAQTINVEGQKFINFSVEDALQKLSPHKRNKFLHFFIKHRIKTKAEIILLTQHFANLGMMSIKEQKHLYEQLRDDILSDKNIIIKKHPDDTLDYKEIFPHADIIKEIFPSEILAYVFRKKPQFIYTFNSTGCENLKNHFIIKKIRREKYAGQKNFDNS